MRRRDTSGRSSTECAGVLASMRLSPHMCPAPNSRKVPRVLFLTLPRPACRIRAGRQAGSLLSGTATPWRRLRNASGRSALGPAPGLASARCAELPGGSAKRAFKPATASADIPRGASLRPSGTMNVNLGRQPARRAVATLALALLFGLAACEARAGIAFVKNVGTATGNNIGTSITITLASGVSVAAGNSVILSFVGADVAGAYSAIDSAGNAYGADVQGARSGTVRTVILSAHNVNALAGGSTITVTFPSTSNRRAVTANEFSGLAKTGTFDQSHTGNANSGTADSGFTATTTQAAELLFGAIGVAGAASDTFTAGNDGHGGTYTALTRVNSGGSIFYIAPEYEVVAAANTYKATATITSQNWAADIATYKADSNCGNGSVDSGEDCDQGPSNGTAGSCCSASCRFQPSTTVCRAAANECDVADSCTGSSATCPADTGKGACTGARGTGRRRAGTAVAVCRAAAGECDAAETCTGTSTTCPADAEQPAGTACTADANPCTLDQCDGSTNACTHPAGNAGAVCRAGAGECDLAETCTGTSTTCPTNAFKANGTACTDDGNVCTRDICNGASATCTHPAGNAGTVCRAAAGPCDAAETCTGTSTTCPADAFLSSSTVCRAAVDVCDAAESCTGSSVTCPADAIKAAGTVCRAAAGECDLAESCTGTSTACPTDGFKASGTTCTDDGNPCTSDVCNGTSATCTHPAGNPGAVCRAAADECDVAESGTACTDDSDPCTSDVCSGTSATCTHPAGNAGAVCRAAVNECDVAETCPGATSITFHGAASASSGSAGSATSLAISRPAATAANDVMVAAITAHGSSSVPTITPPAGWTLIVNTTQNGQNLAVSTYWKVAGTAAADPGPYTFTVSSSRVAGGISAYDNVDTTNPINASGGQVSSSTPSITTTVANTMLVACFGRSSGAAVGAPSGMTERFHAESSNGSNDSASESADAAQAAAGASGQKASTGNTANISELIALAPQSTSCPADTVQAAGTSCTDDGNRSEERRVGKER